MYNVLYIAGSGRSGSTLLERILHSADGAAALGEFHCLWRLPQAKINCACGSSFSADPFWSRVIEDAQTGTDLLAELAALESEVCRTGFIARHGFSLARLRAAPQVQRFLVLNRALFASAARIGGARLIVDSSKAGPRAWLLACDPAIRIVHLYRDPGEVILSWRSAKFDPGLGTEMQRLPLTHAASDWWKVEQLVRLLARQHPVHRVDYARLCADPVATCQAAIDALELERPPVPNWSSSDTFEQGQDYHSLNGNPDRFARGPVRISPRRADWSRLGSGERVRTQLVARSLAALYPVTTDR